MTGDPLRVTPVTVTVGVFATKGSMSETEWSAEARVDLRSKVRSRRVRRQLLEVSGDLGDCHDDDGRIIAPNYWQRGITRERRDYLAANPNSSSSSDLDTGEQPWDYILVYKRRGMFKSGYRVLGVYTNAEFAHEWQCQVGLRQASPQSDVGLEVPQPG
jgi:hypothetical protein